MFETFSPAIPIYINTRPYQRIPFQWSFHHDDGTGALLRRLGRLVREKIYNVLFLCTGNSARSILSEACSSIGAGDGSKLTAPVVFRRVPCIRWRSICSKSFSCRPAGFAAKAGTFARHGAPMMDFVFTVCDQAAGEVCPVWPGNPVTAHWGVPDPAGVQGTEGDQRRSFREAYVTLENRIKLLVALPIEPGSHETPRWRGESGANPSLKHVHIGGQAVRAVNPGGGGLNTKIRDQPHALPIDKMSARRRVSRAGPVPISFQIYRSESPTGYSSPRKAGDQI